MNRGYVLDRAGVEAINRAISRVGNMPPAMLDTNRRHRITVAEGGGAYLGYFMVIDASEGDAFKVKVADGATGGASTCKVNNKVFSVPAWTSEAITATRLIVLKYTAATKASGETPAAAAKVELVLLETLPSDDNLNCYYQIGRAIVNQDGSRKIQQDHNAASSNGIAQIYWYNLCDQ